MNSEGAQRVYIKALAFCAEREGGCAADPLAWSCVSREASSIPSAKCHGPHGRRSRSYYRDIKVWLPDEQWGPDDMPSCPKNGLIYLRKLGQLEQI